MDRIVIGVSGASGIILAYKAVQAVVRAGYFVDLVISKAAFMTARQEMGQGFGSSAGFIESFDDDIQKNLTVHSINNFGASIASGSYKVRGMLVIPCSMATLAAIAIGLSDNLLRRAADVSLKERRPLVIVPREAPLSSIHLEHMLTLSRMGAVIIPPVPAWYNLPKTLDDVENFVVGKTLDGLGIKHDLYPVWTGY
ncbi:MAG: UbiX family flavin prenyltransferase [Chlamydiales bacterium]|nr:UbiX family flavin prenyltransferase [Chlamydiales bacterium]